MPIPVKSRSASKDLATYNRQRIHPLVIFGLGVFIFLYSQPVSRLNVDSIVWFAFLIAFILVFRLYDDLLQAPNDIGKPDRDYTEATTRKTLLYHLIVLFAALLIFAFFISWCLACILFCFMAINHIFYVFWVNNKTAAGFLPLVKYPFIFVLQQLFDTSRSNPGAALLFPAIAMLIAFVAFESMEDTTFPIAEKYSSVLQVFSFVILLIGKFNGTVLLVGAGLLSISLAWSFLRTKPSPYLYLVLFLIFRLSVDNL